MIFPGVPRGPQPERVRRPPLAHGTRGLRLLDGGLQLKPIVGRLRHGRVRLLRAGVPCLLRRAKAGKGVAAIVCEDFAEANKALLNLTLRGQLRSHGGLRHRGLGRRHRDRHRHQHVLRLLLRHRLRQQLRRLRRLLRRLLLRHRPRHRLRHRLRRRLRRRGRLGHSQDVEHLWHRLRRRRLHGGHELVDLVRGLRGRHLRRWRQ
mmetsp:Transcript_72127/g.233337  ORF Transcript_72127/g.233337 Transcript_72127/m.233337 type:complete len:205 (+) Transcript_72127:511-1125(+)